MTKVFSLLNQIFASGFSFAIIIVSARLLIPDDFGVISLVIMISLLLSVISQSFINMPIMSNAFKNTHNKAYIFDNFLFQIILILIIIFIFYFFYFFNLFDMNDYFSYYLVVIYFSLFQVYEFIKKILFIENKHKLVTYLEIIKFLTSSIFLAYIIYSNDMLYINHILEIIIIGYFSFIVFSFRYIKIFNFDMQRFKNILEENYIFGKWIFLSNIIQNINSNFYIYISAFLLPLYIIGVLNAIRSLIGFSTVVFLALDNYLTPKFAKLYLEINAHKLTNKINNIYNKIAVGLFIIYILMSIFSDLILNIVYGEKLIEYANYIYIYLLANMFMFFTRPILILTKTIGMTKIMFSSSLPTLFFTMIFTYPIIYIFQVNGALFVMCLAQVIHLASLKYFYNKELRYE